MRNQILAGVMILLFIVFFSCERDSDSILNNDAQESVIQVASKAKESAANIGINIVLNTSVSDDILADLETYGNVMDVIYQINGVRVRAKAEKLTLIQNLPYVEAAGPDAERNAPPIDTVPVEDFADGLSTWNLDAVNVTDFGFDNRQVPQDGTGVYVGVLDTGLLDSWRQYFPEERIMTEYAKSFGGGGAQGTNVSEQPNKWEHDQSSHGTHVTSIILGYSMGGVPVNGVAPNAIVIPVKVLNQNGSGWSSVIATGIIYMADLKKGPLANYPVVVNMSLSGRYLDPFEQAAIDYAIEAGVIIVASAGNRGMNGMGYPGAYEPVISVAASGFILEWQPFFNSGWWYNLNVSDPTNTEYFYITDFSSRELTGQDLDVAAPGSWVVGPYQLNSGQTSYYFLGGTSQASPHVAGIVALMAQKNPNLTASEAETILEDTAIDLAPGTRYVYNPDGSVAVYSWEANATGSGLVTADAALAATP